MLSVRSDQAVNEPIIFQAANATQEKTLRTELISIPTDTIPLDGAFHTLDEDALRDGVRLFRGNTMNFYTGALLFLAPAPRLCFACLSFNRREARHFVDPQQPGGRGRRVSDHCAQLHRGQPHRRAGSRSAAFPRRSSSGIRTVGCSRSGTCMITRRARR